MSLSAAADLKLSEVEIADAFFDLEVKQRHRLHGALSDPNSPFKFNRSSNVIIRNRYGNIQPWDNSRVQLQTPIGGSDYVNASPIKLNTLSGRATKRLRRTDSIHSASSITFDTEYKYIATQGPKEGQFSHFWHMVMQESTGDNAVIVMLTPCYEGNKEKCAQYFPGNKVNPVVLAPERRHDTQSMTTPVLDDNGDPFLDSPYHTTGTNLFPSDTTQTEVDSSLAQEMTEAGQVELVSCTYEPAIGCMVRTLRLTIGSQEKTVIHYLYEHWPDFGKPEAEERAALLRLMKKSKEDAGDSPRIVHCSAGVGRTGTFVALDFLTSELEAGRLSSKSSETEISVPVNDGANEASEKPPPETYGRSGIARHKVTTPELRQGDNPPNSITGDLIHDTVESLRQQRMMMVMNEVQYSLLYEVVKDAFIDTYAEKETGASVTPSQRHATDVARDESMIPSSSSPVGSPNAGSEADTEIAGMTPPTDKDVAAHEPEEDPYAEVAPERIRQNLGMQPSERS